MTVWRHFVRGLHFLYIFFGCLFFSRFFFLVPSDAVFSSLFYFKIFTFSVFYCRVLILSIFFAIFMFSDYDELRFLCLFSFITVFVFSIYTDNYIFNTDIKCS